MCCSNSELVNSVDVVKASPDISRTSSCPISACMILVSHILVTVRAEYDLSGLREIRSGLLSAFLSSLRKLQAVRSLSVVGNHFGTLVCYGLDLCVRATGLSQLHNCELSQAM